MINARAMAGVPDGIFERVWALVIALNERERHFNDLQARYRILASTWLLATFAGIGFVFSDHVRLPVEPKVGAALIALAGAFGISLLWVLDVLVYHDLLIAGYEAGKELELVFPWLPPIRRNFSRMKSFEVRWSIASFYIAGISVLTLSAALALWSTAQRCSIAILALAFGGSLAILIIVLTRRAAERREVLPPWLDEASIWERKRKV